MEIPAMNTQYEKRLVDELIDAYIDWREESASVRDAYRRWTQASAADAELAFSGYRAALDREESASRAYAARVAQPWPR
jgi:hypothetical protein